MTLVCRGMVTTFGLLGSCTMYVDVHVCHVHVRVLILIEDRLYLMLHATHINLYHYHFRN